MIVSIALVLFLVGVLGLIVLKTKSITSHFKEKVAISIFLKDNIKNSDLEIANTSTLRAKKRPINLHSQRKLSNPRNKNL